MNPLLFMVSVYAAKTAAVLIFLIVAYRLLGKREVGQMNLYDLVTVAAVANSVQNAMTGGKGELAVGLAASSTLILIGYAFSKLFVKAPALQRLAVGSPTLILYDGHVLHNRMKREHVSDAELIAALHGHGLQRPTQAAMAVLEIDGSISVVPAEAGKKYSEDLT